MERVSGMKAWRCGIFRMPREKIAVAWKFGAESRAGLLSDQDVRTRVGSDPLVLRAGAWQPMVNEGLTRNAFGPFQSASATAAETASW